MYGIDQFAKWPLLISQHTLLIVITDFFLYLQNVHTILGLHTSLRQMKTEKTQNVYIPNARYTMRRVMVIWYVAKKLDPIHVLIKIPFFSLQPILSQGKHCF